MNQNIRKKPIEVNKRFQKVPIIAITFLSMLSIMTFFYQVTVEAQKEEQENNLLLSGEFVGVGDGIHDANGNVKEIKLDDGRQFIRFEDFHVTNGPDLYVYLSTDNIASDFIDLGKLKANNGNQNYILPEKTNLTKYNTVLIWCKAFSVLFGSANLS